MYENTGSSYSTMAQHESGLYKAISESDVDQLEQYLTAGNQFIIFKI